jgi:hypothetical protein
LALVVGKLEVPGLEEVVSVTGSAVKVMTVVLEQVCAAEVMYEVTVEI